MRKFIRFFDPFENDRLIIIAAMAVLALMFLLSGCTDQFECETTTTWYYYKDGKLLYTSEKTVKFTTDEWEADETGHWTYEPREFDTLSVMVLEATKCEEE